MKRFTKRESGRPSRKSGSRFVLGTFAATSMLVMSCSLVKTRPVQEMSNTSAAIKAAKEVQADVLAPVLYREANEWWLKAKKEYKFKNFELADEYAIKARRLAEQAEFEVIKNAGTRMDAPSQPPPPEPAAPYAYPSPEATPFNPNEEPPPAVGGGEPPPPSP